MMISIRVVEDNGVYFTSGIMHDEANGIDVSQNLQGTAIFIAYRGKRYRIYVADIAEAVVVEVDA